MKDWSDLEDKYQEMREKDSNGAEEFKKKMTERFQRTVQALEEESQAEKRQLQAMHQQRVISRINQVSKTKTGKGDHQLIRD
jgi:amyloid beta A4 protein